MSSTVPERMRSGFPIIPKSDRLIPYPSIFKNKPMPKTTPFQPPTHLMSFSYNSDKAQVFDDSAMRYFVDPPIGSNLKYGYERWKWEPDERGRIDSLLKAISMVKMDSKMSGESFSGMDVVSWRGIMTKVMIAPYEEQYEWELNVMTVNGTLYLEEHFREEDVAAARNMTKQQKMTMYYGLSFESFCTSDIASGRAEAKELGVPSGWGGDVNSNVQWINVCKARLGDMNMVMAGEVDCITDKSNDKHNNYLELKTSNVIRSKSDEERFERKLLKFYFQSFLLGVQEIVVGFRTPTGVLTTVQSFKTVQIPGMVQGKPRAWDPLLCLDWAYQFLKKLSSRVASDFMPGDLSTKVWRVKFVPKEGVSVRLLEGGEVEQVVNGEDRVGFLPRWYWNEVKAESC